MGEIILNGKSYNSGMKYKEVTQAEYNALPSSKLTDGTLYCITDAPGPGEGFPPMIYSYEEREVGVWVDGRPLYQKSYSRTLTNTSYPDGYGTAIEVSDMPSNCDIVKIEGKVNAGNNIMYNGDEFVRASNWSGYFNLWAATSSSSKFIRYNLVWGDYTSFNSIITIFYTKTTDTPGSSKWNAQGTFNSIDVTEHVKVASGVTLNSGFSYKAVKTGNIVTLSASGSIDSGAAAIGTSYNLFTVDDVIAPIANGTMYCFGAGSSNARVATSTNKNISITGGGWCSFTVNWISI